FGGTSSKVTRPAAAAGAGVGAGAGFCCARSDMTCAQRMTRKRKLLVVRRTTLRGRLSTSGLGCAGADGPRVRGRLGALRVGRRLLLLLLLVELLDDGALALGVGVAVQLVVEAREQDVRGREVGRAGHDAFEQRDRARGVALRLRELRELVERARVVRPQLKSLLEIGCGVVEPAVLAVN